MTSFKKMRKVFEHWFTHSYVRPTRSLGLMHAYMLSHMDVVRRLSADKMP